MFPWLRLLGVGFRVLAESKVDLLATTRIHLRAWPNDLDFNFHVNNGRYLTLADIGRMHWFVRTGMLKIARQQQAFPVVGDAIAKFRRDLKPFQQFEIRTRLVGWDHKWGSSGPNFGREETIADGSSRRLLVQHDCLHFAIYDDICKHGSLCATFRFVYVRQRTEILNARAHPAVCNQSDHNRAASFQTAR